MEVDIEEYIQQIRQAPLSYLGIGVIDTKSYKYSPVGINSVSEGLHRPFWSVMIPTYHCANYLVETLKSVLEQDPGVEQMQIEVIDDYSTKDDPEAIVREIGKGRVSFFRQSQNGGPIHNFNTCIQRAKGYWVHILHGDDMVLPGFYSCLRQSLEKEPEVGAAFCRHIYINENSQEESLSRLERQTPGILSNWIESIVVGQRIETPSIVVRRSVYEKLGGFHPELFHTADWEMWKRIAVNYPVWYEPQPLAYYRRHSASHTSQLIRSGANIANIRRAIEISESYLPKEIAIQLSNKARENYAFVAINIAQKMLNIGDINAANAIVWEGLKCSHSPSIIESLITLLDFTEFDVFIDALYDRSKQNEEVTNSQSVLASINEALRTKATIIKKLLPTIIVDAVFFQFYQTGIARVWKSLLEEWTDNGFAKHMIVLDRAGTAPKIPGIRYRTVTAYDYNNADTDREILQQVCDEESANLFISTYYTTPTTTPSVFMAYDMIPEIMGWDMTNPMWREKHQAIQHASAYLAISKNTAYDLTKFFTDIPIENITVAYCGVKDIFSPAKLENIFTFKAKYGISKPYFILVGAGNGYKNSLLFFQSFSQLAINYGFDIICTGSGGLLAPEFRAYTSGSTVHMLQLSDEELAIAYSGAVALIYPSKYEGFGLPILEAMACGCPVITCPNASIPEVAGEAAIYINDDDIDGLANALCEVQKPSVRRSLIAAGLEQAKKFSWSKMAEIVSSALIDTTLLYLNLKETNLIIFPDWLQAEEFISLELAEVIKTLATHSDSSNMTLLIDTNNITTEDAELLLSSVTMNLLMEEDFDITDGLEISLVQNLAEIQWKLLIPRLHGRIVLQNENQQALIQAKVDTLTSYELASFRQARDQEFFFT